MATYDLRDDSAENNSKLPASRQQGWVFLDKVLDFSETGYTAADVLELFFLPAETVFKAYVNVITAEGGTFTFDLKTDESSPQTLISNGDGNVADVLVSDGADGDDAVLEFEVGPLGCSVTLTVDHTVDAAKLFVRLVCMDMLAPSTGNYAHSST